MGGPSITPGLAVEAVREVTPEMSAAHLGSGSLRVLATPAMALLVEEVCRKLVEPLLAAGQSTVGAELTLRHLAPTPVGMGVRLRAEVASVEGRRIGFHVRVWDAAELVGEAEHTRVIIDVERFLKRVQAKASGADSGPQPAAGQA